MVIAPRYARVGELHIDQKIEKKSMKRLRTYHEKRYTMGGFSISYVVLTEEK